MPFIHNCKEQKNQHLNVCARGGEMGKIKIIKRVFIFREKAIQSGCDDMLREFLGCIEGSSELRAYDKPRSMRG